MTEFEKQYPDEIESVLDGAELLSVSYEDSETENSYLRNYKIICNAVISTDKEVPLN